MAGFLDISASATLTVNGDLVLDGGKDQDGDIIGGGGHWQGTGTTISSNGRMFLGNNSPGGFSIAVDNSATVRTGEVQIGSNPGSVGQINLLDAGTVWEVRTKGMSVGQGGGGTFNISDGGRLLFDNGTIVAVGLSSGSNGRMTADGNGSLIDATGALVSVGKFSGSAGTLVLTNQASLLLAQDTFIGDGGNGNLSVNSGSHATLSGALTKLGVGNEAGSAGSISIQGTDSSLTVAGPMIVGFSGDGFLGAGQGAQIML